MRNFLILIVATLIVGSLYSQTVKLSVSDQNYIIQEPYQNENGESLYSYKLKSNISDGFYEIYYDSNLIRNYTSGEIVNGKKNAVWKIWNLESRLITEESYLNGLKDGIEKHYYNTGELFETIPYKNGIVDGNRIQYDKTGNIETSISYKSGVVQNK